MRRCPLTTCGMTPLSYRRRRAARIVENGEWSVRLTQELSCEGTSYKFIRCLTRASAAGPASARNPKTRS